MNVTVQVKAVLVFLMLLKCFHLQQFLVMYTSLAASLEVPENSLFPFSFKENREINLVTGFDYGIACSDNVKQPDWYHGGELVSDSVSDTVHQISESTNQRTLKFANFSVAQMGEFTCVKPCGNCTIYIGAGKVFYA